MNHGRSQVLGRRAVATMAVVAALAVGCGSSSGSKASNTKAGASSTTSTSTSTTTAASAGGSPHPGSTSPAGSSDFCSKISDKEASAVLGVTISRREPAPKSAPGTAGCIKGTPRQTDIRKAAFVSFSTFPTIGPFASFGQVKAKFPDAKLESGVGDQAFYSPSGGLLFAFQGKTVLEVQVYKFGKPGTQTEAVTLAKAMQGRLG